MAATLHPAVTLNIPLLHRLRCAGGDYLVLRELGPNLEEVRRDLDALAAFGFAIELHPYRGAAYRGPAKQLCPDQIEHDLATRWIGRRIAIWSRVASTNDLASRAGASLANDGLVVLAEEQMAGRGRLGRSWVSPARSSILMSVLLFPPPHLAEVVPESAYGCPWLTALGAVATAESVASWTGREVTIKWPNDVRVGGRKIAGILVERVLPPRPPVAPQSAPPSQSGRGIVIGIGLNVNLDADAFPDDLRSRATSLQIERGGESIDRSELCRDLIRRLDHWYDLTRTIGPHVLNLPWRTYSEHLGRVVSIATAAGSVTGRLVDIDLMLGLSLEIETRHGAGEDARTGIRRMAFPPADVLALES
ncbi:MAG TPA: biotin--[acetyl-CoA-carboxylase] ligase [Isosphaeraceae bacterium]|nr:biotin--[acetyl-CoA-carboxylase] ligase [Isosphaeraceae bacterium]